MVLFYVSVQTIVFECLNAACGVATSNAIVTVGELAAWLGNSR